MLPQPLSFLLLIPTKEFFTPMPRDRFIRPPRGELIPSYTETGQMLRLLGINLGWIYGSTSDCQRRNHTSTSGPAGTVAYSDGTSYTLPASVTPDRPWSPEEQGFLPGRQEHWLLDGNLTVSGANAVTLTTGTEEPPLLFRPVR